MASIKLLEQSQFQLSRLKTEFRYSVWIHLQRSYPENSDQTQAIFIHIPKTAGTSLYNLIGYTGIGHVTYRWYESRNASKFQQYFKFAFVRNPWDRLVSAFFYLKKGGSNAMDKHWANQKIVHYPDFDDFVKGWLHEKNIDNYFHFVPQYKFICDNSFRIKMDYIGRFERLDQDFKIISEKLGLDCQLPYVNQSKRRAYQDYYSSETAAIVAKAYQKDIELFNYQF